MNKLLYSLFIFSFLFAGTAYSQRMTDDQVISYVKEAQASGKSQKQMTQELLRRGVTQEQVLRIKSKYEAENGATAETTDDKPVQLRKRTVNMGDPNDSELPADGREPFDERQTEKEVIPQEKDEPEIFGHNLFRNRNLSFEPSANLATPANYRLGPGDEVIIDIWGASENTIRQTISPEGDRFFDLVRWGEAATTMNAYILKEQNNRVYYKGAHFTSGKDEYLPIPNAQYNFSEGSYEQNPGYGSF